ncbi:MAG: clan AA aspartic protease [Candidatus Bathyarchaeota archaeon]|nr:MAG: clan AA aspartic protease [Candidatus Bathyarchaeota archaeon]
MRFELAEKAPVVIVEARVNSKGPLRFLVDTGSSVTVIAKETIGTIGFQGKLSDSERGSKGCCSSALMRVESIEVDNVEAKDVSVVPGNLLTISEEVGTRIDGIIGASLLRNCKVIIDYPKQEICFGNSTVVEERRVKFRFASHAPFIVVEAAVNRKGPYDFLVDTGASLTTITGHTSKALGLYEKASGQRRALSGSFAGAVMTLAKVESMQLGDVISENVDVGLHDLTQLSKGIGTFVNGVIGYTFMKDYRVTINYPKQEISFERVARND